MTDADRLRAALDHLHWSINALGEILNISSRTTQRWSTGRDRIPPVVLTWIEKLSECAKAHPLPENWGEQHDNNA